MTVTAVRAPQDRAAAPVPVPVSARLGAPAPSWQLRADVLVVGSGVAGLSVLNGLAGSGLRLHLVTKADLDDGSTRWAQGGIARATEDLDDADLHVADTLTAGAGLCDRGAVRTLVADGPAAVQALVESGARFDRGSDGRIAQTREGGHSRARIVHAGGDATGREVQRTLRSGLAAEVTVDENAFLLDLLRATDGAVTGAAIALLDADGRCLSTGLVHARATVLATGGLGQVFASTTNPDVATGDGVAMAYRAGARVANLEFIQFHPTCLYHPHAKSYLISEAVRGEGGRLLLPDGTRFMPAHDPRAELAPRDVVARAIDFEMKKGGFDCVYLDISHQPKEFLLEHFPNIYARCLELGIDMATQPIPVVPAAHYTCGGVLTDLQGRTGVPGLYALGETACTGLHGANRLASNSLLECMVFARAAAQALALLDRKPAPKLPDWDDSQVTDSDELVVLSHNWDELRRFMWDYVGIVRTTKRLERAAHRIALLQSEIHEFYARFHVTRDLLELRNLVQVADLIVRSARSRLESRGGHFSRDYPELAASSEPTVLVPGNL